MNQILGTLKVVGVDVLYAAGHVIDDSGVGNFSARLNVDDTKGSVFSSLGLQNGKEFSAEVHLVLRSHDPVIPGMVNEQISSFGGGCTTFLILLLKFPMRLENVEILNLQYTHL